jgi:chromosome segregation ATPase
LTDEASHLADMLEMFREEAGENSTDTEALQGEILRGRKRQDRLAERLAVLDLRIIELEDDLARNEEDIIILEEMVDARLGLR